MNADELAERVRSARARWDGLAAGVPLDAWEISGLAGTWTLRDVVAHITWFEREMIELLRTRRFEGSELWLLPPHERNAAIHREHQRRPVREVRSASADALQELLNQLATLGVSELEDPASFPPMPPDWIPRDILAQNTYEHYEAHEAGLRRWIASRAEGETS